MEQKNEEGISQPLKKVLPLTLMLYQILIMIKYKNQINMMNIIQTHREEE